MAGTKCSKCARKMGDHNFQDMVACAYRGRACQNCYHPPHRDGQWGCATYQHPDDTARDHQLREDNPRLTFLEVAFDDELAVSPGYQAVIELYNDYVSGKNRGLGGVLEGRK